VPFLSLFCHILKIVRKSQKNQVKLTRNNNTTNTQQQQNFIKKTIIKTKTKTYFERK